MNNLSIILGHLSSGDQLQDKVNEERNEAQENTHEPLSEGKTLLVNLKSASPESHDEDLSTNDQDPNSNGRFVRFDANKDPKLVVNLSGSEHVKDLEEYEEVENERQVSGVGGALKFSKASIKNELVAIKHSFLGFFPGDFISFHVGVTIGIN